MFSVVCSCFHFLFSEEHSKNLITRHINSIRSSLLFRLHSTKNFHELARKNKKSNSHSHRVQKHFSSTFGQISRARERHASWALLRKTTQPDHNQRIAVETYPYMHLLLLPCDLDEIMIGKDSDAVSYGLVARS
jgi:hypothetical protein